MLRLQDEITVPSVACTRRTQRQRNRRTPQRQCAACQIRQVPFSTPDRRSVHRPPPCSKVCAGPGGAGRHGCSEGETSVHTCWYPPPNRAKKDHPRTVSEEERSLRNWKLEIRFSDDRASLASRRLAAATPGDGECPGPGWRGGPRRCRHLSVHAAGPSGPRPREPGWLRGASASTPSVSHNTCPGFV